MSRNQRLGLVFLAIVVAVVAFLIAKPGDDEQETAETGSGQPAQTGTGADGPQGSEAERTVRVERIALRDGAPRGMVRTVSFKKGETVRLLVTSDASDEIHVHGYDIEREAAPGRPARIRFQADIEGVFEIESHVAEDAGREPLIARLVVAP